MPDPSAYAVLNLQKGASEAEVKTAFIELVKKYDPEKHTERFMIIQSAYNRLRDVNSRAREDLNTLNTPRGEFLYLAEERLASAEPPSDQELTTARVALRERMGDASARDTYTLLLMKRAFFCQQRKQWPDAIRDWKEILDTDPSHTRARHNIILAYQVLATSYAMHGLSEESVALWEKVVQLDPDNVDVLQNLALTYERMREGQKMSRYWAEAVKRWTARLDQGATDNAEYLKALVIEAHKQRGAEIEHGNMLLSQGPTNTGSSSSVRRVSSTAVPTGGASSMSSQPAATPMPPPAPASSAPSSAPGAAPRPMASSAGVPKLPAADKPADAKAPTPGAPDKEANARTISRLRELLRLNPNDLESQFQLAHKLMEDQNWSEAVVELDRMAKAHPKNTEVLNLMGWCQLNLGLVDPAFATWQRAVTIDPKDSTVKESMVRARLSVGKSLRDKGLFTHALVHFKSLLRLLPNSSEVHLEIAATYDMKGDLRSAAQEYQQVMTLDPKNKIAKKALGDLKMKR